MKYRLVKGGLLWKLTRPAAIAALAGTLAIGTAFACEKVDKPDVVFADESIPLWDVPLEPQLQHHIKTVAERYGVEPELVIAVIGQESNYEARAIGDDGRRYGLMQVQPAQHEKRMDDLGILFLQEPYGNVLVGCDYLAECVQHYGETVGLMVYNGGAEHGEMMAETGQISEYAESVLYLRDSLKECDESCS